MDNHPSVRPSAEWGHGWLPGGTAYHTAGSVRQDTVKTAWPGTWPAPGPAGGVHRYQFYASVQDVKSTTERSSLALRPWVRLSAGPATGGVSEGRRKWLNFTYLPL